MKLDSSLARNSTASAISLGSPMRWIMWDADSRATNSSRGTPSASAWATVPPEKIAPGQTMLQRMLSFAQAKAIEREGRRRGKGGGAHLRAVHSD